MYNAQYVYGRIVTLNRYQVSQNEIPYFISTNAYIYHRTIAHRESILLTLVTLKILHTALSFSSSGTFCTGSSESVTLRPSPKHATKHYVLLEVLTLKICSHFIPFKISDMHLFDLNLS